MDPVNMRDVTRRDFLQTSMAGAAAMAITGPDGLLAPGDEDAVVAEIAKQHDATVQMLRDWIALPSIAAENRNYPQGAEYMARLARDAGFGRVDVIPTKGKPGVFATLDAGAADDAGALLHVRREAVRPGGVELAAARRPDRGPARRRARSWSAAAPPTRRGRRSRASRRCTRSRPRDEKLPVNLVLVCEGEEEIGSPNFSEIVFKPEVEAALRKCVGIIIPLGNQELDGSVQVNLGAKGIVELELVSTGEKWGRGPTQDVHSSYEAQIDSPAWHLVQALNTLVKADGHTPAVEGFFDKVRPLSPQLREILEEAIPRRNEAAAKKALGVSRWYGDESWHDSLVRLVSQPTINIEGLVGGYTGPGGKTILPHRAVAKIDMRLVPGHDRQGHAGAAQEAPREARLRRRRGEHDRRLRSDRDAGGLASS